MPLLIIRQDITKLPCDVIVNATNRHMTCDSGVSSAILNAAGEELREYLHGSIDIGDVRVTPAFNLPCKRIFHVVGPVWQGGDGLEKDLLALCYKNALKKASELGYTSIAIPLISSGARGFPKEYVLKIAVETIAEYLYDEELDVYLVVYDKNSYSIGKELFGDITEYINDNYVDESEVPIWGSYRRGIKQAYIIIDNDYFSKRLREPADERKPKAQADDSPRQASQQREERPASHKYKEDRRELPRFDEDEGEPLGEGAATPWREAISTQPSKFASAKRAAAERCDVDDIHNILAQADDSFAETLFKLIDARGMTDLDCYKKANVSRQTWHKIISDESYRPSKATVIAFAIALRLDLDETKHLLETVGFALSKSLKFDLIIEYFISRGEYDIYKINNALFEFDQALLGV